MKDNTFDVSKALDDGVLEICPSKDDILSKAMALIRKLGRNLTAEEFDNLSKKTVC